MNSKETLDEIYDHIHNLIKVGYTFKYINISLDLDDEDVSPSQSFRHHDSKIDIQLIKKELISKAQ